MRILLAALDVHPRVAMQILRHAQISITMDVYTEVPDEVTRANGQGQRPTGRMTLTIGAWSARLARVDGRRDDQALSGTYEP